MRILENRKVEIKWLKPTFTSGTLGSKTANWTGTPSTIMADVQPMKDMSIQTGSQSEYGELANRMRSVYVENGLFEHGDGIWLPGESLSDLPWRVTSVSKWRDITILYIEKVL